ncbi:MAG: hypothetical protein GQ525_08915, partial [Draconibacterium sp.]|nr:hypothetical protein [Draconibacterium sp.]
KNETFNKRVKLLTGIMNISENHKIEGKSISEISSHLIDFIRHRNYGLDRNSIGVKTFVEVLADKVYKLDGELIADDYNFITGQFNTWFTLEQMIIRSNISETERSKILNNYANKIIVKANPIDLDKERDLIYNFQ